MRCVSAATAQTRSAPSCCQMSTAHHVVEHSVPHVHDWVAEVSAVRRLVIEAAASEGPMMRVMSGQ